MEWEWLMWTPQNFDMVAKSDNKYKRLWKDFAIVTAIMTQIETERAEEERMWFQHMLHGELVSFLQTRKRKIRQVRRLVQKQVASQKQKWRQILTQVFWLNISFSSDSAFITLSLERAQKMWRRQSATWWPWSQEGWRNTDDMIREGTKGCQGVKSRVGWLWTGRQWVTETCTTHFWLSRVFRPSSHLSITTI